MQREIQDILRTDLDIHYERAVCIDGRKHRVMVDSTDSKWSGWYQIQSLPSGLVIEGHNFRNGKHTKKAVTDGARETSAQVQQEWEEQKKKEEALQELQYEKVAEQEALYFERCESTGVTPYVKNKSLHGLHGARRYFDSLIVPLRDVEDKIWSLERISSEGKKIGTKDGRRRGCFFTFGTVHAASRVFLAEGWATGACLFEAGAECVVVVFGASNVEPVIQNLKKKYGPLKWIAALDADSVGKTAGQWVKKRYGAIPFFPPFEFTHPDYTDWADYQKHYNQEKVKQLMAEIIDLNEKQKKITGHLKWIKNELFQGRFTVRYSGLCYFEGQPARLPILKNRLFVKAMEADLNISQPVIESIVTEEIDKARKRYFDEKVQLFSRKSEEGEKHLNAFIIATLGALNEEAKAVLRHFVWQVKRKMAGLEVEHHMMPVFWGESGSGKSMAVKAFLKPLGELVCEKALDVCGDERNYEAFEIYSVLLMDEMAKADKTDSASLKRIISLQDISYRQLGTHTHNVGFNRASLIGTSNEPVESLIKDSTSNRRFYSLRVQDGMDWPAINACDYLAIWQSVSLDEVCPIFHNIKEIVALQKEERVQSDVEMFLESLEAIPSQDHRIQAAKIYKLYGEYARANGFYVRSIVTFASEMKRIGILKIKTNKGKLYQITFPTMEVGD